MPETQIAITCSQCGAGMAFDPGLQSVRCSRCGTMNTLQGDTGAIAETDLARFLADQSAQEEKLEVVTVRCTSCGASSTMPPHVVSSACPFCGTNLVVKSGTTSTLLKPKSLLPFAIAQKDALERMQTWLRSLWFAPFGFAKAHKEVDRFAGVYLPYWTYDAQSETDYTGERGEVYYTTETYTAQENGRTVTRTRQVRHVRWYPAQGHVSLPFDDVLVLASHSLPEKHTVALEPWDLDQLVPFDERFLAGFRTEAYQVKVNEGFAQAQAIMEQAITRAVRQDIGGDEQRIHGLDTGYSAVTFKHILLPVWISAFRYQGKVFRFLINGRTGEVQGERPWSAVKIVMLVLGILGAGLLAWGLSR